MYVVDVYTCINIVWFVCIWSYHDISFVASWIQSLFFFTNILDAFTSSLLVLYSKHSGECWRILNSVGVDRLNASVKRILPGFCCVLFKWSKFPLFNSHFACDWINQMLKLMLVWFSSVDIGCNDFTFKTEW